MPEEESLIGDGFDVWFNKEDKVKIREPISEYQIFNIPGIWEMYQKPRQKNKALCLLAMIILEIKQKYHLGHTPTQVMILNQTIELGAELSPNSKSLIDRWIASLIEMGHVIPKEGYKSTARGGNAAPWVTQYLYEVMHTNN